MITLTPSEETLLNYRNNSMCLLIHEMYGFEPPAIFPWRELPKAGEAVKCDICGRGEFLPLDYEKWLGSKDFSAPDGFETRRPRWMLYQRVGNEEGKIASVHHTWGLTICSTCGYNYIREKADGDKSTP